MSWINRTADDKSGHGPIRYTRYDTKIIVMFKNVYQYINPNSKILDVGCNSGGVSNYLYNLNYKNIYGFDINYDAINKVGPTHFPEMFQTGNFHCNNCTVGFDKYKDNFFDLVFSKGLLFNISYDNIHNTIMNMIRVSSKYILIFEGINYGKYKHNYKKMFTNLNCEIVFEESYEGSNPNQWKNILLNEEINYNNLPKPIKNFENMKIKKLLLFKKL